MRPKIDGVGSSVRQLRLALGLTQSEAAGRAGIDRSRLSTVETDKNKASSAAMRKALADGFGVSLDDFNAYLKGELKIELLLRRRGFEHHEAA